MLSQNVVVQRRAEQTRQTQLAQALNAQTAAESFYSPAKGEAVIVKTIYVCNVTGAAKLFSIFHDEDGTTYDTTTSLIYDKTIAANDFYILENADIYMNNSSGNLAVKADAGQSICFTAYGEVTQTRAR